MNKQLGDYKYMANLIDSQANRIREQQEHIDALLKLVEVYRNGCTNDDGDCCHGQISYCTTHNECLLYKAEKEYEKTIKR